MAAVVVTAANVKALFSDVRIRSYIANADINAGQSVYMLTTGKVDLADASSAGKQETIGIALSSVKAGTAVNILIDGEVGGFTVSALSADVPIYQSDTPGGLADAAGTKTVVVGRVVVLTDGPTITKVLRFYAPPATKR